MLKLPERDPIPVNELARALDKNVATIYRWGSPHGVRGHRLRLVRVGGRTAVFHADWEAFWSNLNGPTAMYSQVTAEPTHDEKGIDAELDAAGF